MDSFHPLQPILRYYPIAEQHPAAAPDLEASRSRSRTHNEVSDAATISYPDPTPDPPRQSGQEEPVVLNHGLNHLILCREVLPVEQLNSTQTLLEDSKGPN